MDFSFFPLLPLELRSKIWHEAAHHYTRIIEVHWASGEGYTFHSYSALLSVSREAQQELKHLYPCNLPPLNLATPIFRSSDILYYPYSSRCGTSYGFAMRSFFRQLSRPSLNMIRHVAFSVPRPEVRKLNEDEAAGARLLLNEVENGDAQKRDLGFSFLRTVIEKSFGSGTARNLNNLETVTLVIDDPIMTLNDEVSSVDPCSELAARLRKEKAWELGAACLFEEIDFGGDGEDLDERSMEECVKKYEDICVRIKRRPGVRWMGVSQPMCKVLVRTARRKEGDWKVGGRREEG